LLEKAKVALGAMILGVGFFGAFPQQVQAQTVTCVTQDSASHTYPLDNVHALSCLPAGYPNKSTIETQVFGAIQGLPKRATTNDPLRPWDLLKQQGVKVFIFKNRADSIAWMTTHAPYMNAAPSAGFYSPVARCGQTGHTFGPTSQRITISVFAECTLDQNTSPAVTLNPNPSWRRTALHEAGHAFDYALASTQLSNRLTGALISTSPGFQALMTFDKSRLTPADWSTRTDASKNSYICAAWGTTKPSALERDLGATTTGGAAPNLGAICSNATTPYAPYKWPNGRTPEAIIAEKIPYFYNTSGELWAEQFQIKKDGIASPAGFLQMTDKIIDSNQGPIQNFKCTEFALLKFYDLDRAPTSAELQSQGCPTNPGSFNHP